MTTARAQLERDGVARVTGVLRADELAAARAHVLAAVEPLPWIEVAGALRPGPGSDETLRAIGHAPALAPVAAAFARAVDEIFGAGVWTPVEGQASGQAFPARPFPGAPWEVPHAAWHVDEPIFAGQAGAWGLLGFALLDRVDPGGGATVAIAGSHRLLDALAPEDAVVTTELAHALVRDDPWFTALFAPGEPDRRRAVLDAPHAPRGVPVRVVELTGDGGDLLLMDPRCLHTVSANASPRARLQMRLVCRRAS